MYFNQLSVILTTTASLEGVKSSNLLSNLGQFLFLIFVFIFILILAYFSTKLLASGKVIRLKSQNLQIVESVSLGLQGGVHIVKAGDRYFLIGVTKEKITYLTEIDSIELKDKVAVEKKLSTSFESILGGYMSNLFNKGDKSDQDHKSDDNDKKVE